MRELAIWFFFFSSRRRHTRFDCDWSSDVCSSDLAGRGETSAARSTSTSGSTLHRSSCVCIDHGRRAAVWRDCAGCASDSSAQGFGAERERGVEGKRGELGGRRIIKKKKKRTLPAH